MNKFSLNGLNPKQLEAVQKIEGVYQIVSVAGSGKTRVLTYKVANMILNENIKPENILMTTFSKKAADEMKERLAKIINKNDIDKLTVGTFHGIAYKILKTEFTRLQHPLKEAFAFDKDGNSGLLSNAQKQWFVQEAMKTLKMDTSDKADLTYNEILRIIGTSKNNLISVKGFYEEAITAEEFQIAEVYKLYEEKKKAENKIDFDDMLIKLYQLFKAKPSILQTYQNKFKYVLIDEGQDNNKAQYELARMLAAPHNNIMLVGDDDQSLYAFRGAKVKEFINFKRYFPQLEIIKLEHNYRSTPGILRVANKVIKHNTIRLEKEMIAFQQPVENDVEIQVYADEDQEAESIAHKIKEYNDKNVKYKNMAVLFRTNAQTRAIEDQFIKNAIPYVVYGGQSFYEIKEVKDLISYLELVVNKDNNKALENIINVPTRYLGKEFMKNLKATAKKYGVSLYKALKRTQLKPYQHRNVMGFLSIIEDMTLRYQSGDTPDRLIRDLIEKIDYYSLIKSKNESEDDNDKSQNVDSLLAAMSRYKTADDFLKYVSQVRDMGKKGADAVQVMTIHRSKGLEFKKVFMSGVSEGLLPHRYSLESGDPNSVEQERCLAYVGMTRAEENLHMYSLNTFNGKNVEPSRFMYETELIKVEESNQ